MVISVYVFSKFSFWGLCPQTPPGFCPWTRWGTLVPRFCPLRNKFLATPLSTMQTFFVKRWWYYRVLVLHPGECFVTFWQSSLQSIGYYLINGAWRIGQWNLHDAANTPQIMATSQIPHLFGCEKQPRKNHVGLYKIDFRGAWSS